jgi:hypothetical protein
MHAKVTISLDEQTWLRFKAACALTKVYPSRILEEYIKRWLKQREAKGALPLPRTGM